MVKEIDIPADYKYSFQRLMRLTPEHYRQDPEFIKEMLVFLKIGGEKLARKNLEAYLTPFDKEFALRRKTILEDETADSENASGTNDEKDAAGADQEGEDAGAQSTEKTADSPQETADPESAADPDHNTTSAKDAGTVDPEKTDEG